MMMIVVLVPLLVVVLIMMLSEGFASAASPSYKALVQVRLFFLLKILKSNPKINPEDT